MNKKQVKELNEIDEVEGISGCVKNTIKEWDDSNLIKSEWSIIPLLYLAVDNKKLNENSYKEYEDEYRY